MRLTPPSHKAFWVSVILLGLAGVGLFTDSGFLATICSTLSALNMLAAAYFRKY